MDLVDKEDPDMVVRENQTPGAKQLRGFRNVLIEVKAREN